MWVYYAVLGVIFLVIALKVVDSVCIAIKNQHDAVRKADFLDALIEAFILGRR